MKPISTKERLPNIDEYPVIVWSRESKGWFGHDGLMLYSSMNSTAETWWMKVPSPEPKVKKLSDSDCESLANFILDNKSPICATEPLWSVIKRWNDNP